MISQYLSEVCSKDNGMCMERTCTYDNNHVDFEIAFVYWVSINRFKIYSETFALYRNLINRGV